MGASGGDLSQTRGRIGDDARSRTLIATAFGVVVSSFILFTPYLTFGVQSPRGHLVLNTLDACVGLLAAFLVYGRFVRHSRLQDLLLLQGLALLVVAGLGLSNVADLIPGVRPGTLDVWLPVSVRVGGALLIAAAAVVGPSRRVVVTRSSLWPGSLFVLLVAITALALGLLHSHLPVALDLDVRPESAQHPILTGHPVLLVAQALAAVAFAVAAVLFTRQGAGSENELLLWLGPACVLGAFARLNYVLFPSLYTDWIYTGDVLRTGFYALLLLGAAREIRRYWTDQADLAVLEDRRRLARELHDGVIQELGFIRSQVLALPGDPALRQQVLSACDRGLEEARSAIAALGAQGDEPLSVVLARATRQLAGQYGIEVVLELDDSVVVNHPDERHALVRIAREAVINAVKHGAARTIYVGLSHGPQGRHLAVRDDGLGFDPDAVARPDGPGGFGLVSMRDRARGLDGELIIESEPGAGSKVTVTW